MTTAQEEIRWRPGGGVVNKAKLKRQILLVGKEINFEPKKATAG